MGGRAVLCAGRMNDELEDPGRHDEEQRGGRSRLHGLTKLRDIRAIAIRDAAKSPRSLWRVLGALANGGGTGTAGSECRKS